MSELVAFRTVIKCLKKKCHRNRFFDVDFLLIWIHETDAKQY